MTLKQSVGIDDRECNVFLSKQSLAKIGCDITQLCYSFNICYINMKAMRNTVKI